jgi:hypothetical protein
MVIKRVVPMSVAKIMGVMYAAIRLLIGAFVSLFAIGGAMIMATGEGGFGGVLFGAAAVVILPVLYGGLGFVVSFISALIFNAVTGLVGGVEIEVQ